MKWSLSIFLSVVIFTSPGSADEAPLRRQAITRDQVLAVAQGNTQFATDFYAKIRSRPGNLVCSPYSISTVMALLLSGAEGETAAEIAKVMHYPAADERLHPAYGQLRTALGGKLPGSQQDIKLANAVWLQKERNARPDFWKNATNYYGATIRKADFADARKVADEINRWIDQNTGGRIQELATPEMISRPLLAMILVNAICFDGTWQQPFAPEATRPDVFNSLDGSTQTVPMMNVEGHFHYTDAGNLQLLELPYSRNGVVMNIILPRTREDVPINRTFGIVESLVTPKMLEIWLRQARPALVSVSLPKFKLENTLGVDTRLQQMGLRRAFQADQAEFSRLIQEDIPLWVEFIIQKAMIDVNEKGTQAAAATLGAFGAASEPETPVVFRADHPFLFIIRHRPTNSILFIGRYSQASDTPTPAQSADAE